MYAICVNVKPSSSRSSPTGLFEPLRRIVELAVEQSLPWKFALDTAYVGDHGVRNPGQYNLNAGTVLGVGTHGQPEFPRTAAATEFWQGFSSSYNALQVKLDRQFSNGLLVTTAFTWEKGMSYQTGDDGSYLFYVNFQRNYARTDFDRTLTYVQSFVYQLPWGNGQRWMHSGLFSRIFGNWQVSGSSARTAEHP